MPDRTLYSWTGISAIHIWYSLLFSLQLQKVSAASLHLSGKFRVACHSTHNKLPHISSEIFFQVQPVKNGWQNTIIQTCDYTQLKITNMQVKLLEVDVHIKLKYLAMEISYISLVKFYLYCAKLQQMSSQCTSEIQYIYIILCMISYNLIQL